MTLPLEAMAAAEAAAARTENRRVPNLGKAVDTSIRSTERFSGAGVQDIKSRFETVVSGCASHLRAVLTWAEEGRETPVLAETVRGNNMSSAPTMLSYDVLVGKTEREGTVKNASGQNGGEAWRELCGRFSSNTRGKQLRLTRRCVNPPHTKHIGDDMRQIGKIGAECGICSRIARKCRAQVSRQESPWIWVHNK